MDIIFLYRYRHTHLITSDYSRNNNLSYRRTVGSYLGCTVHSEERYKRSSPKTGVCVYRRYQFVASTEEDEKVLELYGLHCRRTIFRSQQTKNSGWNESRWSGSRQTQNLNIFVACVIADLIWYRCLDNTAIGPDRFFSFSYLLFCSFILRVGIYHSILLPYLLFSLKMDNFNRIPK